MQDIKRHTSKTTLALSVLTTFVLLVFIAGCKEEIPPPPDTTEIAGTWQTHSLVVSQGNSWSSWQGWVHATLDIDNIGNASFSNVSTSPGGNSSNNSVEIEISDDDVITVKGDLTYHAYLSADKQMAIATMTDGGGGYNLSLAQKVNTAVSYSTTDALGIWQMHLLSEGKQGSSSSWGGWTHALLTFDAAGNGEFSNIESSPGGNTAEDSVYVSVSSSGVITDSSNASYHGFISADKQMMVATMTGIDEGFTLAVGQKIMPGTTYSLTDLVGTWHMHSIISGNNTLSEWAGWTHGILTIDASAEGTFSGVKENTDSNQSTVTTDVSILSDGVVTVTGDVVFHGYLSADKNTLVATTTDSRGGYTLSIFQKEN